MGIRDIIEQIRDPKCKFSRKQAADEIERLRAELAAATARLENALNEGAKRRAERDALRALLKEARSYVQGKYTADSKLAFIIDAALNKGGEDE